MSRRSSRASMGGDNGEFYLECKAAYLSIYDSIKDEIESEEDLVQGLLILKISELFLMLYHLIRIY